MSCEVLALLFVSLFAIVAAQNSWCKLDSCRIYNKGTHTLCAYPNAGPQQKCFKKGNLGGGVSADDRTKILNLHNEFRQKVASGRESRGMPGPQPKAAPGGIPDLQWDYILAAIAQRWADQCAYGHDQCRDTSQYQVGQNVGYSGTTANVSTIDVLDIVRSWYNEVQYFNKNEVPKFSGKLKASNGKDIGHYTQVVWGQTTKIGCGMRNYFEDGFNRKYLVCNYGPSGNFPGQPVYKT